MSTDGPQAGFAALIRRHSEIAMAGAMLLVLMVLLIPLPGFVLDLAITFNISIALLVLLITMNVRRPLEFNTFPSLLLFTTLYRLSLNVASTRLILLRGNAGGIIESFGDFVVGGDLVVGLVIFVILLTIQFVVITKGSTRISEVAARFTLDAMPGKQMAIDADLNAGLITEEEARERRETITSEAEFYGAMDGAGKFVRGDAVAGLIITVVNLVGGVGLGLANDLTVADALRKYAILTVGDGLVSQIPALVIAIAAGILVTKTRGEENLTREMADQFLGQGKAARIAAAMVAGFGLVPGMPTLPFLSLGAVIFVLARTAMADEAAAEEGGAEGEVAEPERAHELTQEALGDLLKVDRLGIEIGFRLIPMVDETRRGGLLDHIAMVRRQFAQQYGLVVPPIRMRDNLTLEPNAYRVLLSGQEIGKGELYPDHVLAMNPGTASEDLEGVPTTDPTFGLPATWVPNTRKSEAEMLGYTLVDTESVLVTHLTEIIKDHAHEILSREDVQHSLDRIKEDNPTVVQELVPDVLPVGTVQKVLVNLLRERIPIRNLPAILECLADEGRNQKDPDLLTESVRQSVARVICENHVGLDGRIPAVTLEPAVEQQLADAFAGNGEGAGALSPALLRRIQEAVVQEWQAAQNQGHDAVLLVRPQVRRHIAELFRNLKPPIPALSFNEVLESGGVDAVGVARIQPEAPLAEKVAMP